MTLRLFALVGTALVLAGCAITNETSIVVGTPRSPLAPEQVKLYTKPPARYEEIAIVSADAAHDFMAKQELMNIAIAKIKGEAAKVGANGILLDGAGDYYVGTSGVAIVPAATKGMPVIGFGSANARTGKQASGRAIYVLEE